MTSSWTKTRRLLTAAALWSAVVAAMSGDGPLTAAAQPPAPPSRTSADDNVRTTIAPGAGVYPVRPAPQGAPTGGDITLNYPSVDVADLARTILGDTLGVAYTVSPTAVGQVTLITPRPVRRSEVLGLFEEALKTGNFALARRGGAYVILPLAEAKAQAEQLGDQTSGFGDETMALNFLSAPELKKLIDPAIPNAITVADPVRNVVVVSGTTAQRRSVRELIKQFDVDWLRGASFALYVTKHTDSRLITPELDKLLNSPGSPSNGLVRLISMDRLNGILAVTSQPQYLQDVQRWVEVLDREGESNEPELFVYNVQNGRSADLAKTLVTAFGGGNAGAGAALNGASANPALAPPLNAFPNGATATPLGPIAPAPTLPPGAEPQKLGAANDPLAATITSDETNNAIVVYATPRQYAVIEKALRRLDVVPLQVMIEAAITEVQLNRNLQYGVQWQFKARNNTYSLSNDPSGLPVQVFPGFSYLYNNMGGINATLNALSSVTTINVLSAPKLMVLNNHTASLQVGDQVPITTASSVSTVGSNSPIVNSVDYRDTGVILKVTPRVNSSGLVLLDITQEVSDVAATSTSSINSPTIQERKLSSSIAVEDGQTIALGGLIRDNRTLGRNGVPYLSAIPVLGALVGQRTDTGARTELLILLTPRVIRNPADAKAVTDDLRTKIDAIKPLESIHRIQP